MKADYGIEWAYGEFRIARFVAGKASETWVSPMVVSDLRGLSEALHMAADVMDVDRGGSVAIVYEDDLHTHEAIRIPRLDGKTRRNVLGRKVESSKSFEGEAAWCYCLKEAQDGMDDVLLHMMPKTIVQTMIRICEDHFLLPRLLLPVPEIIRERIPSIADAKLGSALVVVSFSTRTQMLVCGPDGDVMLVRELGYTCSPAGLTRLLTDVRRTSGYAKQNAKSNVGQIICVGELAAEVADSIEAALELPVRVDEESKNPSFWMAEVAGFDKRSERNFISKRERRLMSSRALIRAGILTTALTTAAAVASAIFFEFFFDAGSIRPKNFDQTIAELEERKQRIEAQMGEVSEAAAQLSEIDIDAFNLPALFATHLGSIVPDDLVLTEVSVMQTGEGWEFDLSGVSSLGLADSAPVLRELEQALTGAPWNATVVESWELGWLDQLRSGAAASATVSTFQIKSMVR